MKRLWLGIGILTVLLAVSIAVTVGMDAIHSDIAKELDQAQAAASAGDWEKAEAMAEHAAAQWRKYRYLTASVADHSPMDEMDEHFAELRAYGKERETADFTAACARLAVLARAMGDSHALTWWNLL